MRKYLALILAIVGALGFILYSQVFFPNKYERFTEYYIGDDIIITSTHEKPKTVILEPYSDESYYYIEVVETNGLSIQIKGDEITPITINGYEITSDEYVTIETRNNNILLKSKTAINIEYEWITQEVVNAEQVTNSVVITVGSIIGLLILVMIVRSELPKKFRITVTLAVVTSLVFILKELMNDMFWVLVSADIGWITGLILSKMPSKKSKKLKEKAQIIESFLGNV